MKIPQTVQNALLSLIEAALDARTADVHFDDSVRVTLSGQEVKVRVQANDHDHPKEIVIHLKWRTVEAFKAQAI